MMGNKDKGRCFACPDVDCKRGSRHHHLNGQCKAGRRDVKSFLLLSFEKYTVRLDGRPRKSIFHKLHKAFVFPKIDQFHDTSCVAHQ